MEGTKRKPNLSVPNFLNLDCLNEEAGVVFAEPFLSLDEIFLGFVERLHQPSLVSPSFSVRSYIERKDHCPKTNLHSILLAPTVDAKILAHNCA